MCPVLVQNAQNTFHKAKFKFQTKIDIFTWVRSNTQAYLFFRKTSAGSFRVPNVLTYLENSFNARLRYLKAIAIN